MQTSLRSHKIAVELYQLAKRAHLPRHLKDQLVRASSSAALNLMEGWGRRTHKDRQHFFTIAFGSTREVQSIIELENLEQLRDKADHLAACLYKLTGRN